MANEFKRERRYTIFKHKDIEQYLTESEIETLMALDSKINFARQQEGKPLRTGLIIESDWPEFEPVSHMLEGRVASEQRAKEAWEKLKDNTQNLS